MACSPPFNPTIAALGPDQIVFVGTTGEKVAGGRLFHVERVFNGTPTTPLVIAFKEGEPIGDCRYPVPAGMRLIIAPDREPDGRLSADLATLQADPDSVDGRRYLAEAIELVGPGAVPLAEEAEPGSWANAALVVLAILGPVAVTAFVVRDRARTG